ncbi:hypothetical protein RFI_07108 [Reticulomyxa filosa]|uniref:Serine/threonine specific protein phosphatases domain-containing protein n=1 Tax=Reticulomyxa filosa TaxID=46433 RepID=X6NVH8_RETFI|nr:hypothetical protein RFI_07108 [Reticulomyxa filosa]|eukprot:ETO30011.1 hypothetical protein RFI_07108 [Reticulomyxa filosa]
MQPLKEEQKPEVQAMTSESKIGSEEERVMKTETSDSALAKCDTYLHINIYKYDFLFFFFFCKRLKKKKKKKKKKKSKICRPNNSHPNVVHYNLPSQSTNGSDAHVGKDEKTDDVTNVSCNVSTALTGQENGNATRITVCGDVHGQYYDFLNIFKLNGVPNANNPYLFNGDFVDRGSWSMEVILVMLSWKCVLPTHFMMTRGNHESKNMNEMYGFKGEVEHKYETRIYQLFCELFNWLPLAYILGSISYLSHNVLMCLKQLFQFFCNKPKQSGNKIFVCHGGLFQEEHVKIKDLQQLNRVCQPSEGNINPPKEASIMSDLLWSDPQPLYGRAPSKRGGGIMFGPDITKNFLQENNLQMVIRSHEVEKDGFKIHHNGQLVTIFSAPNYVDSMGNKGAYILLNQNYRPTYYQFDAVEHPDVKPMVCSSIAQLNPRAFVYTYFCMLFTGLCCRSNVVYEFYVTNGQASACMSRFILFLCFSSLSQPAPCWRSFLEFHWSTFSTWCKKKFLQINDISGCNNYSYCIINITFRFLA